MTDDLDNQDQDSPGRLRQMYEDTARERAELAKQLEQLQRKDAFRDAGFDLSNKQHAAFAKAYDGELSPDAVKAYADDLGVTNAPTAAPEPPPDLSAHQRLANATAGDGAPPPDQTLAELQSLRTQMDTAARNRDLRALDELSLRYDALGGDRVALHIPST